MLQAILNKSWRQHPTKHQLYSHLPLITKTIKIKWTRHAGHCWRSRNKLISDVLLWTPSHGWAKAGRPAWTYMQQLCANMGCSPEDLPQTMDDREGGERVRDIRADGTTWWWSEYSEGILLALWLTCSVVTLYQSSSNSSHATVFTYRLGKVRTSLFNSAMG